MPAHPANIDIDRPPRMPAFEALGRPVDRRRRYAWLPFAAIAAIVLLVTALFLATLAEERQLQRETLLRDFDSAAQQLSSHFAALSDALSAAALEVGADTVGERRFRAIVTDLADAKPEILRVLSVNAEGRLLWEPEQQEHRRNARAGFLDTLSSMPFEREM